ncbi:MAG TPA: asparaginase, partial [Rhizomicrobium sp.]|nr:asparaginase [Rhizomicrobium sp.]
RLGLSEADLACGPQLPRYEPASSHLLATQQKPSRLHNNCSGKHTGFLTVAKHLGASISGYVAMAHPVQQAVLTSVARLSGVAAPASGIDGCAAPNFALPLTGFARALAQIAGKKTPGAARILTAMTTYPELVSGTGRMCAKLMRAATGGVAVKMGAEGVYAAMLPGQGLGIAIKIDDGAVRGAEVAVALILEKLGVLDPARSLATAPILNTVGAVVGEVRPSEVLRAIAP